MEDMEIKSLDFLSINMVKSILKFASYDFY